MTTGSGGRGRTGRRPGAAARLRRGYTERDVRKVLGENLLRVFRRVWT